jgi:putative endonuclease
MHGRRHTYWVYLLSSISRVLYCGVTNNLYRRVEQHREGESPCFTRHFRCSRLVWYEAYHHIDLAIAREKQIKRWSRSKKIALIVLENPTWVDLSEPWRGDHA